MYNRATQTGYLLIQLVSNSLFIFMMATNLSLANGSFKKVEISFDQLPGWTTGGYREGFTAFLRNCQAGFEKAPGWSFHTWESLCRNAKTIKADDTEAIQKFITNHFSPFLIIDGDKETGLFTGYYQPIAEASLIRTDEYATPLYRKPSELIVVEDLGEFREDLAGYRFAGHMIHEELKPYYSRAEIVQGILEGKGLEIAWLKSRADAFFIAVQGSGLLQLANGKQISIGYDGANGLPYTSIGKVLKDKGHLPENNVTMQSIRQWLADHPDDCDSILSMNRSYIFFKELPHNHPEGAHKIGLTPLGSLAVDPRFIPLGSLLWLATESPKLNALVVAQDTGSAIKGIIRGDFYWGTGAQAGEKAGTMAAKGQYYILEPKIR